MKQLAKKTELRKIKSDEGDLQDKEKRDLEHAQAESYFAQGQSFTDPPPAYDDLITQKYCRSVVSHESIGSPTRSYDSPSDYYVSRRIYRARVPE